MENLLGKMQQLMETASSMEDFEFHESDLDSYFERLSNTKENALDTIVSSKVKVHGQLNAASPSQSQNVGAGDGNTANAPAPRAHAGANLALKLEELTLEHTPQEMRVWQAQFRSYYSTCTLEDQHAYFLQCLNPTLRFRVE